MNRPPYRAHPARKPPFIRGPSPWTTSWRCTNARSLPHHRQHKPPSQARGACAIVARRRSPDPRGEPPRLAGLRRKPSPGQPHRSRAAAPPAPSGTLRAVRHRSLGAYPGMRLSADPTRWLCPASLIRTGKTDVAVAKVDERTGFASRPDNDRVDRLAGGRKTEASVLGDGFEVAGVCAVVGRRALGWSSIHCRTCRPMLKHQSQARSRGPPCEGLRTFGLGPTSIRPPCRRAVPATSSSHAGGKRAQHGGRKGTRRGRAGEEGPHHGAVGRSVSA